MRYTLSRNLMFSKTWQIQSNLRSILSSAPACLKVIVTVRDVKPRLVEEADSLGIKVVRSVRGRSKLESETCATSGSRRWRSSGLCTSGRRFRLFQTPPQPSASQGFTSTAPHLQPLITQTRCFWRHPAGKAKGRDALPPQHCFRNPCLHASARAVRAQQPGGETLVIGRCQGGFFISNVLSLTFSKEPQNMSSHLVETFSSYIRTSSSHSSPWRTHLNVAASSPSSWPEVPLTSTIYFFSLFFRCRWLLLYICFLFFRCRWLLLLFLLFLLCAIDFY